MTDRTIRHGGCAHCGAMPPTLESRLVQSYVPRTKGFPTGNVSLALCQTCISELCHE